jgi:hypothetical protein
LNSYSVNKTTFINKIEVKRNIMSGYGKQKMQKQLLNLNKFRLPITGFEIIPDS